MGVNGTALICHGASESRTIKNAIMASKKYQAIKLTKKSPNISSASTIKEKTDRRHEQRGRIFKEQGWTSQLIRTSHRIFNAVITGHGSYAPPGILTNEDFAKMVDTSDEWIKTRTGIKSRHKCCGR